MDNRFHGENRRKTAATMLDGDAMLFFSGESVRKTADADGYENLSAAILATHEETEILMANRHQGR